MFAKRFLTHTRFSRRDVAGHADVACDRRMAVRCSSSAASLSRRSDNPVILSAVGRAHAQPSAPSKRAEMRPILLLRNVKKEQNA